MHLLTTILPLFGVLGSTDAFTKSSGCGKALPSGIKQGGVGSSNSLTINSGGIQRSYLLHVPTNYGVNSARKLIFDFHGRGGSSSNQEALSQWSNPFFNKDNLVVYPQGVQNQWQGDPDATTDDISFVLTLIDTISSQYCIDTDGVYTSGKSNGGGFSLNVLACNETASQRIAAFAGASGAYYQVTPSTGCNPETVPITCSPGRSPIPILEFHGSADTTIPFYGGDRRGDCLPSVNYFIQSWASRNGFDPLSNVTTYPYSSGVHKHEFGQANGQQGLVTNYWVNGLAHSWPSTVGNSDSQTPTYFNATAVMMNFFNRYPLK